MSKGFEIAFLFIIACLAFDYLNDKHQFFATNKQEQKQAIIIQKDLNADSVAYIIDARIKKSNDSLILILKKQITNLSNQNNQLYEDYLHDMALATMLYQHSGSDSLSKDTRIHRLN